MADGNGLYRGEFERLMDTVDRVDKRTHANGEVLSSLNGHLSAISQNTAVVAKHFAEVQKDNRTASRLLGKVLLAVIVFIGVYAVTDNLKASDLYVKIPIIGVEIGHHQEPAEKKP